MRTRLALTAFALTLAACSNPVGPGDSRAALEAARQRWEGSGIVHYRMTVQRLCECLPSVTRPVVVVVRGGEVAGVSDAETAELLLPEDAAAFPSVDGLFDLLAGFLDQGIEIQVVYDPTWGHPVQVFVDLDAMSVDDEVIFEISALEPDPDGESLAELNEAARAWSDAGFVDYDLDLRRTCDCETGRTGTVLVRVRGGAVVSRRFTPIGGPVPEEHAHVYPTVSGLFDTVLDALNRGADALEVDYDPNFGIPERVSIDYRAALDGDEVEYEVVKLLRVEVEVE
ncbi:MAG TPA: DUF6174 domain-containing protein [Gemmatimonadota bacterium]|nr:DUF6174 domain-containing protein [Gemmatimonadota bacterium]